MFSTQTGGISSELTDILKDGKERELGLKLMHEFGVPLKLLQDQVKIEAIKDPVTFMTNRKKDIETMFVGDGRDKGIVAKTLQEQFKSFKALGLPDKEALELASESTRQVYETTLRGYDLKYTDGYNSAFGVANAGNVKQLSEAKIADDSLTKGKKYYKNKYKRQYEDLLQNQLK